MATTILEQIGDFAYLALVVTFHLPLKWMHLLEAIFLLVVTCICLGSQWIGSSATCILLTFALLNIIPYYELLKIGMENSGVVSSCK